MTVSVGCSGEYSYMIMPYPKNASVNTLWRVGKHGVYVNPKAKAFRDYLSAIARCTPKFGDQIVRLEIKMSPPDNRKRDIDNLLKCILDALQDARVYDNDHQVHQLYVEKLPKKEGGELEIRVKRLLTLPHG